MRCLSPFVIAPAYAANGSPGSGSATPDYSVATFALLPSDATVGQRVAVTGESGLSGVVCVNTAENTWELETVTATYGLIAAVEWGTTPGQWYSSGGITVTTAADSVATDTTNKAAWRWIAADTTFAPSVVIEGTPAGVGKIKGDSAAPSGWTATTTAAGGTATITAPSGTVILTAIQPGPGNTFVSLTWSDASFSSAGNIYVRAMLRVTTNTGRSTRLGVVVADGTDAYDFGSSRFAAAANATGQWFSQSANGAAYTAQSGAQLDLTTALTLVEIVKRGTRIQARVAGGVWVDLTGATARDSASKSVAFIAYAVPDNATLTTAILEIKHAVVMRF